MKQPTAEIVKQWFDVGWKAALIIACGALAWASRDNRIATHELRLNEHDRKFETYDAKFDQANRDMLEVKTGIATLLERTKGMGQ